MELAKHIGTKMDILELPQKNSLLKILTIKWYILLMMRYKKKEKSMENTNAEIKFHLINFKDI